MKKLLYVFIGLGILYFILAFFSPSEIKVERSIFLEHTKAEVKPALSDFTLFHKYWNPWSELDSSLDVSFRGKAGEVGHAYLWSGNSSVEKGKVEITGITQDSIYQKLQFGNNKNSVSYLFIVDSAGGCKVSWSMVFPVSFLGRTPMLFMNMDKMIGQDYEKGLQKLKENINSVIAETAPVYEIKELAWDTCTYLGRKQNIGFEEMDGYFEANFGLLEMVLEKENIKTLSPPSGMVFTYDEENQRTDVSCAFKVPNGTKVKNWESFTFPACKVLSVEYKGFPSGTGDAHKAIDAYMQSKGLQYQMVIEEYLKGPDANDECYDCVTMVYYLLK
ncbi:MAG: SRPBCC family protein [Bacteroidia bacterium]|jgi:effector-binding domain-containing protein|nr:SRPBCC family protein [Bacteroidia bacterium]